MTNLSIQALGYLLSTYQSDLEYIRNFQKLKSSKSRLPETIKFFKLFVNEFKVARNVKKSETEKLIDLTLSWISQKGADNVDEFALFLKKEEDITHEKVMTVLASKILFLNNPWMILPFDKLTKNALKLKTNNYTDYLTKLEIFKIENQNRIDQDISSVKNHLTFIESNFVSDIQDLSTIRRNRYIDKLLWTKGKIKDS